MLDLRYWIPLHPPKNLFCICVFPPSIDWPGHRLPGLLVALPHFEPRLPLHHGRGHGVIQDQVLPFDGGQQRFREVDGWEG